MKALPQEGALFLWKIEKCSIEGTQNVEKEVRGENSETDKNEIKKVVIYTYNAEVKTEQKIIDLRLC